VFHKTYYSIQKKTEQWFDAKIKQKIYLNRQANSNFYGINGDVTV